jgi:EAL domain-containing protein (putative c-di-GMP-specific phosphodiesterase class I)
MPLTDLVRYLNDRHWAYASPHAPAPFVAAQGRVLARFAHLQLASRFLPIVETATGQTHGHAADLQVFDLRDKIPLPADAVFDLPADDDEFIFLDRLTRTLHALNYLTHPVRGNLLLRVRPRHVLSVPSDHGLAFEEILRPCGLLPKQITLELEIDGIDATGHLRRAVANYKARRYHLSIYHFGRIHPNLDLLEALQPEIVRLDPRLLESQGETPSLLAEITSRLQDLKAKILIESVDTQALRHGARALGIDLLQTHSLPEHTVHPRPAKTATLKSPTQALPAAFFAAQATG